MATLLGKIIADFRTQLATKLSIGASSVTLQSATDDDGVALPAGQYYFTIDGENSQKEHIYATLSGTSLTSIYSVSRQGARSANAVREHRVGASVVITDFAHIKNLNDLLDGTTDWNALVPLKYDANPTISNNAHLATKKYVDDVAIAGAPDATETVKGIIELATGAELAAGTSAGGTGARLVAPSSSCKSSSAGVGDANKIPVLNANGRLAASFGGAASSLATLDGSSKVVEDPANATATPTASRIPIANGSGKLAEGWLQMTNAQALDLTDGGDTVLHTHNKLYNFVYSTSTPITFGNSTTETNLLSTTLPANVLKTAGYVRVKLFVSDFDIAASGPGNVFTGILYYGTTAIATVTITNNNASNQTNWQGWIEGIIMGSGATNTQAGVVNMELFYAPGVIQSGAFTGPFSVLGAGSGTAAEDSTTARAIRFTGDWNNATVNSSITISHSIVEYIAEN
jgi:hypothetical protein